jgi:hypothetical protein
LTSQARAWARAPDTTINSHPRALPRYEDADEAYEDEGETLDELAYEAAEGPAKWSADLTLLTAFTGLASRTTPRFRGDWIKLSGAGLVGTSREFRKSFCKADRFEVARVVNGKRLWTKVAEVWGRPMVYALKPGTKAVAGSDRAEGLALVADGAIDFNAPASALREPLNDLYSCACYTE